MHRITTYFIPIAAQLLTFYHIALLLILPLLPYVVIFAVIFEKTLQILCPCISKYFCLYKLKNEDTTIVQLKKNQQINFNATSLVFSNCSVGAVANVPLLGIPFLTFSKHGPLSNILGTLFVHTYFIEFLAQWGGESFLMNIQKKMLMSRKLPIYPQINEIGRQYKSTNNSLARRNLE